MADYQSLLTRAVANLQSASAAAARQAIYDRARVALVTQLRSLRPPLPDSDIEREERALDRAIAQVEEQLAAADGPTEGPAAPPQPSAPPIPPKAPESDAPARPTAGARPRLRDPARPSAHPARAPRRSAPNSGGKTNRARDGRRQTDSGSARREPAARADCGGGAAAVGGSAVRPFRRRPSGERAAIRASRTAARQSPERQRRPAREPRQGRQRERRSGQSRQGGARREDRLCSESGRSARRRQPRR